MLNAGQGWSQVEKELANHHRLALVLGHAYVPRAINIDGSKGWLVLASWGLDYDYILSEKWLLGLHADMIAENFRLEEHFNESKVIIERSRPLAAALMFSYKLNEQLAIMLGGGGEFAKEENLALLRAGLEYSWKLAPSWEVGASIMNDLKLNTYNSWTLGLSFSKFL